ncbi:hypothetical protein [Streptomyces sp. NPDC048638]|uniref:hypothetical protein n=1 Tax=Streptomyces sp. NPDC048638 TaxID=3365580 RepID=UPI003713791B
MNTLAAGETGAVGFGAGATLVGVLILIYVIRLWKGGKTSGRGSFLWGICAGILLGLGGGILGTIGATAGWAASTGGGILSGTGGGVPGTGAPAAPKTSGGEKSSVGSFLAGAAIVAWNAAAWASDKKDGKNWFFVGALVGVCLGAAGGIFGTLSGAISTTGGSVGQVLGGLTG